jgi:TolB protein
LAFVSDRDGNDEIYVMSLTDQSVVRLTDHPSRDRAPAWSPDGTEIAFVRELVRGSESEVFIMNSDGSEVRDLTSGFGQDEWSPAWSPDGEQMALASGILEDCINGFPAPPPSCMPEIIVMNLDGSGAFNLSHRFGRDEWPAWSPDGQYIAYMNWETKTIFFAHRDGNGGAPITSSEILDWHPAWGPANE